MSSFSPHNNYKGRHYGLPLYTEEKSEGQRGHTACLQVVGLRGDPRSPASKCLFTHNRLFDSWDVNYTKAGICR